MKNLKLIWISVLVYGAIGNAQTDNNLTLSESFINLSLTNENFDKISDKRMAKIIPFIEKELATIEDQEFIISNNKLYNVTYAYLYFLKAKILYKNTAEADRNREVLFGFKNTIDKAIRYFNSAAINESDGYFHTDSYYIYTGFTLYSCYALESEIENQKGIFNVLFNQNVYPDFKRVFYETKDNPGYNYKEELTKAAGLFNISNYFSIYDINKINNNLPRDLIDDYSGGLHIDPTYKLTLALDLIYQSLEFNSAILNQNQSLDSESISNLYENYHLFSNTINPDDADKFDHDGCIICYDVIKKDSFFIKEFNRTYLEGLYNQLQKKYPYNYTKNEELLSDSDGDGISDSMDKGIKYYFPIPAPKPSIKFALNHFKPGLKTLKETNNYITNCFTKAGYLGRLHYYFINEEGFAITTSIEKINKDGSPAPTTPKNERWNLTVSDNGKFTLYEILKAMFMATESDYRVIACIVAKRETPIGKPISLSQMDMLIENSYAALPTELENKVINDKTITILVYHFSQSDVGEVPILLTNSNLSVVDHLSKTSTLINLTKL